MADIEKFRVTDVDVFFSGGSLVFHGKNTSVPACGQNTAQMIISFSEDQRSEDLEKLKDALAMKVSLGTRQPQE